MTFPPAGGILEHKGGFLMREFFHNMKLSFLLAAVLYIILGLVGVNFLIELGINLVLSPIIERIIRLRKKGVV